MDSFNNGLSTVTSYFEQVKARDFYVYNIPFRFTVANEEDSFTFQILNIGDFVCSAMTSDFPGEFFFNITDASAYQKSLFSAPVSSKAITGNANFPFFLPVTYTFPQNHSITIKVKNGSTANNTGTISLIGATVRNNAGRPDGPIQYLGYRNDDKQILVPGSFFVYSTRLDFIANDEPITESFTIYDEAAFELFYIINTHDISRDFTFNIEDMASGRTIFRTETPDKNISGDGQNPFKLPFSRIFPARGSLTITATNGSASGVNPGQLVLAGANLYGM